MVARTESTTSAARCLAVCEALAAGREPPGVGAGEALALRQLLRVHGLSGLATQAIEAGTLHLPEATVRGIEADWEKAQISSRALDRECGRIAAAYSARFQPNLSPPLVLKGPAVARRYRHPALRCYVDIDLLVPVDQVHAWAALLRELGYWAPPPEVDATARRYQEGVAFTNEANGLTCDLHACLFIEPAARNFTYDAMAGLTQPSAFAGFVEPTLELQLIVLALHLAHHPPGVWRLVWLHDFIEMATSDAVSSARTLAAGHGLGWALEAALFAVERIVESPVWDARPSARPSSMLARVHQLEHTGYLRHVALAWDLGPRAALWYAGSRLTPRRFTKPAGFDRRSAMDWIETARGRARSTPWSRAIHRRTR